MARMVEVGGKLRTEREAEAEGRIRLRTATIEAIRGRRLVKGDVETLAKAAAVAAVKRTPETLPLCHPIEVTGVEAEFETEEKGVRMRVRVRAVARTGVEMEALCGVTAGLLCVWDVVKGLEKDERGAYPETRLEGIAVTLKRKGGAPPHHHEAPTGAVRTAFITVSSSRTAATDGAGAAARELLERAGYEVVGAVVGDDEKAIREAVERALADCEVVIVSGGTGIGPKDVTPEALDDLWRKEMPGFASAFSSLSMEQVGGAAMLSRARAGVTREGRILFALPGNPRAVTLALERLILPQLQHLLTELRRE